MSSVYWRASGVRFFSARITVCGIGPSAVRSARAVAEGNERRMIED